MDLFPHQTSRLPARSRRWARLGGAWLEASIEYSTTKSDLFDLALSLRAADGPLIQPALSERHEALSLDPAHPRYAARVLAGSEIVRLANALHAGTPERGGPERGGPERRPARRAPTRKQVASAFALLALLVPGIALVPAVAHADGGGGVGGGGITTSTVPTRTNPTPPPTTTEQTTTQATTTDATTTAPPPATTAATTTTSVPTPTPTTPAATPKPHKRSSGSGTGSHSGTGASGSGTSTTSKPAAKKSAPKAKSSSASRPAASKKKTSGGANAPAPNVPSVGAAAGAATISLPNLLPDPTPPSLRLRPGFAENLAAAAARAHVDWALMLGVIRAQGAQGAAPATGSTLAALASRLRAAGADANPAGAARSILAKPDGPARAVALANYYHAVGLPALVHGLEWAKPGLQQRILDDPRVHIYAGGRSDISSGRVNVRVLATIEYLAQTFDEVTVSCLITGHPLYARPGVISAHIYGLAVDIAALDNVNIIGHQGPGTITEKAIRSLLLLPPEMQPNQVISLMALGGPSFALASHWNHIHVGFAPIPYTAGLGEHDGFAVPPGVTRNLLQLWQSAGATYGVPWQVLAAINKIESNFGQNMGPSSAGAVGWMQFEPSTWAKYGMDASGDGKADPYNAADAIYSAARYLAAAGANTDLPRAIFAYNHAQWYVDQVLQLASLFGNSSSAGLAFEGMALPTFTLGNLQPEAPARPNALPDTALGHGAVVEEDRAPATSMPQGAVVDDPGAAPAGPPDAVIQQAKLEAGFAVLRTLIGGAGTPSASGSLAASRSLPSALPSLAGEPEGASSLHAGYQLNARQQQAAGLNVLGSLLGF